MADSVSVLNEAQVLAALKKRTDQIEKAAMVALMAVAFEVERQAKINALTGQHERGDGHIPGTGPGPNRVTGALIRSITTERKQGFDGMYSASVYPTMVYSRAVELGNERWKSGVRYPYLEPAANQVRKKARKIFIDVLKRRLS